MSKRWIVCLLLATLVMALNGCVFAYRGPDTPEEAEAAPARPLGLPGHAEQVWTDASAGKAQPQNLRTDTFVQLADRSNPAVVNIFSEKNIRTRVGDPLGIFTVRTPNLDFNARALGTGFFISADGFLLTNAHVVAGADEIKVFLWQEDQVEAARLIGLDRISDLALLKIEHDKPLPFIRFADSDAVQIGEFVVAIGNPFGLAHSLTNGLISAKHRRLHEDMRGRYEDYLQTSAQINPGNSGGPLLNLRGEMVGVNTATVQGGQAIGFAVPSNLVREVIPHLVRSGAVRRAYIGVTLADLTAQQRASLAHGGALISDVENDSPAATAGLRRGDMIVSINGRSVYDAVACSRTLTLLIAEREAKLKVVRNGETRSVAVTPTLRAETGNQR